MKKDIECPVCNREGSDRCAEPTPIDLDLLTYALTVVKSVALSKPMVTTFKHGMNVNLGKIKYWPIELIRSALVDAGWNVDDEHNNNNIILYCTRPEPHIENQYGYLVVIHCDIG
jgi:hypothetical protein